MSLPVVVVSNLTTHDPASVLRQLATARSAGRVAALVPAGTATPASDAALTFVETVAETLRLGQGCGCCMVRGDIREAIRGLADSSQYDEVLVHTRAEDDLSLVSKTFTVADDTGFSLGQSATFQSLVSVVSVGDLLAAPKTARRAIEQIEIATVVLLAADGAEDRARERAAQIVAALNPGARLLWAGEDASDADEGTPPAPFDLEGAQRRSALLDVLYREGAQDNGLVQRFAFHARRPFHPTRLQTWLAAGWPGLLRARGQFWVASAHHVSAAIDIALGDVVSRATGQWYAATPEASWPRGMAFQAYRRRVWDPHFGDRRQEIAFVGLKVDAPALLRSLKACLATDAELSNPAWWESLPHPFAWDS